MTVIPFNRANLPAATIVLLKIISNIGKMLSSEGDDRIKHYNDACTEIQKFTIICALSLSGLEQSREGVSIEPGLSAHYSIICGLIAIAHEQELKLQQVVEFQNAIADLWLNLKSFDP